MRLVDYCSQQPHKNQAFVKAILKILIGVVMSLRSCLIMTHDSTVSKQARIVHSASAHKVYIAKVNPIMCVPSEEEVKEAARTTEKMVERMKEKSIFSQS
jgi:hypothetical protein